MSEKKQITFAKGLYFKKRNVKEYEIIAMSVKVDDFIAFLNTHRNDSGYVNIDLWESTKEGSDYSHNAQLNDWKPDPNKSKANTVSPAQQNIPTSTTNNTSFDDDLPF